MSSWDIALLNATCVMVGITTLYQALRSICSMGPADPYAPIGKHTISPYSQTQTRKSGCCRYRRFRGIGEGIVRRFVEEGAKWFLAIS